MPDTPLPASGGLRPIHLESATPEQYGGWQFVVRLDDGSLRSFVFVPIPTDPDAAVLLADLRHCIGIARETSWEHPPVVRMDSDIVARTVSALERCFPTPASGGRRWCSQCKRKTAALSWQGQCCKQCGIEYEPSPAPATEPGACSSCGKALDRQPFCGVVPCPVRAAAPTAGGGERCKDEGVLGLSGHRYRVHPTKGFQRKAVNEVRWHETRRCLAKDAAVVASLLDGVPLKCDGCGETRPLKHYSTPDGDPLLCASCAPVSPGTEAGEWPKGEPSIGLKPLLVAMKHLADEDTHTGPPGATGETLIEAARWIHSLRTAKETAEREAATWARFNDELRAEVHKAEATARGIRELVRAAFDDGYASAKREPMVTVSGALYDRSDTKRRLAALDGAQ